VTPVVVTRNCKVCDVVTLASGGEIVNGPWIELSDMIVTLAEPLLVESDCKTAVTVTISGAGPGTEAGAVYKPAESIAPIVIISPPVFPFTCQETAALPEFCTSALNGTRSPVKG
jgi:hypothetical protein